MPIIFTLTKKHPSRTSGDIKFVVVRGQKFNVKEFENWAKVKLTHAEIINIIVKIYDLKKGQFLQISYCPGLIKAWIHKFKEWLKDD